jgi:class 3 adenylate cyclase
MLERKKEQEMKGGIVFEVRIGINTGPVVAGIVGLNKYGYDIWGNTVNLAARMEQNSEAGKINISGSTYMLVRDKFKCEYRGKIEAKNKGEVEMYFVDSPESSARRVITPTSQNQIILP